MPRATSGPAYFDQWYADMGVSPTRDVLFNGPLGLPAHLQSNSLLSWQGIAEVTGALRLPPDGLLVDLACGRGGYGIEVAGRMGARLLGVDFSAVALDQARSSAARLLPAGRAEFRLGGLADTGLPDAAADGVLCVDAVQFAEPPLAALREARRLLVPGGRLVLSTWEAVDPSDERVPARIRAVDQRRDLPPAGFVDVSVDDRPDWRQVERAMWEQVVAGPTPVDDPAVNSLLDEGRQSLERFDSMRRVLATATAP